MSKSLFKLFIDRFRAVEANTYDSDQLRMDCPYCHRKGKSIDYEKKMYVHLSKMRYYCQRCKSYGSLSKFLEINLGEDFKDIERYIEREEVIISHQEPLRDVLLGRLHTQVSTLPRTSVELPKEYISLKEETSKPEALLAYEYLFNRGLDVATIYKYNLGYCSNGKYRNRIIIPCYEEGRLIYFVNRLYMWGGEKITPEKQILLNAVGVMKSINLPKTDEKEREYIGKTEIVFNLDRAKGCDSVIIVEGPFDALRVGDNAVAILGSFLSKVQAKKILEARFKKVYIALDPDARANEIEAAKLLAGFVPTFLVGLTGGDPGELSEMEIHEFLKRAKRYNKFDLVIEENLQGG